MAIETAPAQEMDHESTASSLTDQESSHSSDGASDNDAAPSAYTGSPELPGVGTKWETKDALKIACYNVCLKNDCTVAVHQSSETTINLFCTFKGYAAGHCTYGLIARAARAGSPLEITHSCSLHSHGPLSPIKAEADLARMRKRLQASIDASRGGHRPLRSDRKAERPKSQTSMSKASVPHDSGDSESSESDADDDRPSTFDAARVLGRAVTKRTRSKANPPTPRRGEAQSDDDEGSSSNASSLGDRSHPQAENQFDSSGKPINLSLPIIRPRIEALRKGPHLAMPTSSSFPTFPSHTAARIYASAAALQCGFTVFVHNSAGIRRIALLCSLGHSRYGDKRCHFKLHLVQNDDSTWGIQPMTIEHNHPLNSSDHVLPSASPSAPVSLPPLAARTSRKAPPRASTSSAPRKRPSEPVSINEPIALPHPPPKRQSLPAPSVSSARPSFSLPIHAASSSIKPASYPSPHPSPAPPAPHLTTGAHRHFHSTLKHFLTALSPSLAPYTGVVHASGVHNVQSLKSLVGMREDLVAEWVGTLGAPVEAGDEGKGMPKLQQVLLRNALHRVKKETREEIGREDAKPLVR